jgi:hypothetical protein
MPGILIPIDLLEMATGADSSDRGRNRYHRARPSKLKERNGKRFIWKLLQETVPILMEGAPRGLDLKLLHQDLHARFPICNLHHLHVWEVNSAQRMLTVKPGCLL